jgi:hypothetical protein
MTEFVAQLMRDPSPPLYPLRHYSPEELGAVRPPPLPLVMSRRTKMDLLMLPLAFLMGILLFAGNPSALSFFARNRSNLLESFAQVMLKFF